MAFNGSGTFTLVAGNPVVTGTTISSTWANNTLSDIATNGLTNCITKNGETTVTANIPFGGFRLTGIGSGTAATDAAQVQQVQRQGFSTVSAASGATTITGSVSPAPSAYIEGMTVSFTPVTANAANPTFNLNSLGALLIFWDGATCTSSMWRNGSRITMMYLSTSQSTASTTGWHVMEHSSFIPAPALRVRGSLATTNGTGSFEKISPSADDEIPVSTASASAGLAFKSLGSLINGLTALTTADASADFVPIYSTTAGAARKVTPGLLGAATIGTKVALASVSATADWTIPGYATQIIIGLSAGSLSGSDNFLVQLGDAGGIEAAGYTGVTMSSPNAGANSGATLSAGFIIGAAGAGASVSGSLILNRMSADGTWWVASGVAGNPGDTSTKTVGGQKELSAALTTVRLTRTGNDVFDAGTANASWR